LARFTGRPGGVGRGAGFTGCAQTDICH
jgi:hypothetical protein